MNKKHRPFISLFLCIIFLSTCFQIGNLHASAASSLPYWVNNKNNYDGYWYYPKIKMYEEKGPCLNYNKGDKMSYKLSDRKKFSMTKKTVKNGNQKRDDIILHPKKTGKSKLTVTLKSKGKSYKKIYYLYVKEYDDPFEQILVGDNDITSHFAMNNNRQNYPEFTNIRGKNKLSIKLKKDYKINEIYYYNKDDFYKGYLNNYHKIKNGSIIDFSKLRECTISISEKRIPNTIFT